MLPPIDLRAPWGVEVVLELDVADDVHPAQMAHVGDRSDGDLAPGTRARVVDWQVNP